MKTNLVATALITLTALASCKTNTLQPETPTTPSDSISVFKKLKISWAATDYKQVEYDASNTPIRYTRQNLYVQGTNEVRKVVYDLIYTGKQLTRVEASNGSYVNYSYEADQVNRTEEFSANGKLISTRQYQYFPDNRLSRLDETQIVGNQPVETAKTFTYDERGNLSQVVDATKDAQTGTYRTELITRYSDYDSHKSVANLWILYPLLPNVTFQVNNPASITQYIKGPDGAEMQLHRSNYVFRYNTEGYPVTHTETDPGGTLTATYTYVGQ